MNPIRAHEFRLIPFEELIDQLWDFRPNSIQEIGESCFKFYIDKASGYHNKDYYIEELVRNEITNGNCNENQNNQDDPYASFL